MGRLPPSQLAGEPAATPTPEPVQQPAKEDPVQQQSKDDPDPPAGTIETITATADDTGQLLLTWDSPRSAKRRPHGLPRQLGQERRGLPSPTQPQTGTTTQPTTTLTLAGLEYDTDYKVRVQSSLQRTARTPPTRGTGRGRKPPPRSSFSRSPQHRSSAAIAVSRPIGQVLADSWFNLDEDDSITGLPNPARSRRREPRCHRRGHRLEFATSYTDETPPARQTHTYGVKARNASGLSPLSNTLTATVPAAEVLIVARHEDGDNTLVSNLGQTAIFIRAVVGTHVNFVHERAMSFTTGNNPYGYHLTNSQLYLRISAGSTDPIPGVSIRNDNEGIPGQTVLYTMTTTSAITPPYQLITFTTTDDFTLQPNTKYWLYVTINDGEAIAIRQTQSDDENVESNTDWEIGDSSYRAIDGGAWTEEHGENMQMNISGHAAPAFLVSNLDSPSTRIFLTRQSNDDSAKLAQSFSAVDNTDGTPVEFDFHGITVLLKTAFSTPKQLAASDMTVTVHSNTGGQPGDLVHTLTSPETYTVPSKTTPMTFSASPGSILSSGITYWVKFEIAADSEFFVDQEFIIFEFANDNNEVQGPTTHHQWIIDDYSLWSPEALSWMDEALSLKMAVLGSQRYDTLVSNIDQTFLGAEPTGPDVKAAQSFLTPPGPLGQQYRLNAARFNASSQHPTHATIDLHADDNGVPGDHLASMTMPGNFAPGDTVVAHLTVSAPKNTNLNTGTRYWFVFSNEQLNNPLYLRVTESKAQDSTSLNGWTIGDRRAKKEPDQPWSSVAFPIQMELLGTPFIRTNEADGPDLPGAGHNAHKTGAIVTPGIVSTGHLTAGLDYDYGQTGDFWWLDTQRGHSYRIEVEFGDDQNNDTGGSAWTYFIEGDRRGTCCESDHNRDDGYTFVHLKHGEDDRDRRYLIDIAAFDKLNHNSRIYNGPYTITMTDITGTEKVATNLYLGTRAPLSTVTRGNNEYAVSFTTGNHPSGYELGRVYTHALNSTPLTRRALPEIKLRPNASGGTPGRDLCNLRNPYEVQHHRPYAVKPLPVLFLN